MFTRRVKPPRGSSFLFGPRGTGKSTWLASVLPEAITYDLLDTSLALRLAREPGLLAKELAAVDRRRWVVVDEVQKVPALLDEVHRLIERERRRFVLSGSSARKLRRGGTNLLAGRAVQLDMFPLVSAEVGAPPAFDRLPFGMLPAAVQADRPQRFLSAYVTTYLKEEVQAEALTRNIGGFARFLEVAAIHNAQVTNVSNIARDAQVARQTVQAYFDVLVDTLLGTWLHAWKLKRATKLVAHPKFYFFDAGVARALSARLPYRPTQEEMGAIFETYVLHELRAFLSYTERAYPLYFFRTHDDVEVDVIFEAADGLVALEIKASRTWRGEFDKGFRRIRSELDGVRCIGVYNGERRLQHDDVAVYPYGEFLEALWEERLFE
jgi:predicted AAA+ superfamily ATPase